ncbi:NAD(+) synthase [Candidatus Contubernalis alkaliaceticus]|uniref:NAD(+) synthase n=1 Tax=Candidatus Contubernalis alkaliaceticus TaxID=338645 RepID=UPI001F4C4F1B|nr:NAD(+) synthase [Candidatus Contubernalis alkalaceticus]UNC93882.1 NAD(+) synthase [Candidatus Contubernalis alkalaceticus]
MEKYIAKLVDWIEEQVKEANAQGTVFGLSGGVDSSVVAAICKRAHPKQSLGVIMPCYSEPMDEEHALLVADSLCLQFKTILLDDVFDLMLQKFGNDSEVEHNDLSVANIKPRLRMTCLYFYAARHNYLVVGSSNRSELEVGYFTKHGDGAVDIMPLAGLTKGQVTEMAHVLDIPREILEKPPSGGLWPGQTDEAEMGVTYKQLDKFLLTGQGEAKVRETVKKMNKKSQHKRKIPPVPRFTFE